MSKMTLVCVCVCANELQVVVDYSLIRDIATLPAYKWVLFSLTLFPDFCLRINKQSSAGMRRTLAYRQMKRAAPLHEMCSFQRRR